MNVKLFKSLLRPYWNTWSVNNLDDAADKISKAYHLSNIGDTAPFFGAKLIKGDKETLKKFLSSGLKLNFRLTQKLPDPFVEPGFTLMANGFCLYWINSRFIPIPPMPPMIAPTSGVQVLFPGVPFGFDKALKKVFNDLTDVDDTLTAFTNALIAHQLTVAGTYSGLVPAIPSPIPLVLPWVGLLSLPELSLKVPDLLKNQDTDGDGISDYLDDDIDGDGIPNNQDSDKDGDGIPNADEPGKINVGPGAAAGGGTGTGAGGGTGTGAGGGTGTGAGGGTGTGAGGGTGTDPNFDPTTGFDNGPDPETGQRSDATPIDEIFINQDSIIQEYFGNLTKEKLSKNKFKPQLFVDSRQRTGEEGYRSNYLQLIVSLREQVLELNNGDKQYQFYIEAYMNNSSAKLLLQKGSSQPPESIGIPRSVFTFTDTIESNNSIYAGTPFNITSPKQRGLLLMKSPYESILDDILDYFNDYTTKYFNGRLRKKFQKIDFFLTTEPRQDSNPFGNQIFTKMTNFVNLQ